jgi:PHD/YefM family antitoxin component YafN of YafNO toxin-antitoxin module
MDKTIEGSEVKEQILSISEIQKEITRLPEQMGGGSEAITVTRYGKPVLAILPFESYKRLQETTETLRESVENYQKTTAILQERIEALLETLEIIKDEELMASFRRGMQDLEAGRTTPWEDVKKELGLE